MDNPILTSTKYPIQTLSELKSAVLGSKDEYVAVDTETTGLSFILDRAFGVALCWDDQATFVRNGVFEIDHIGSLIKDIFASDKTFVFHNAEFDLHMLRVTYGVEPPKKIVDTLRVAHLLDSSANHTLKHWGEKNYGASATYYEQLVDDYRKKYHLKDYAQVPQDLMFEYASNDVILTKALAYKYVPEVKKDVKKLFDLEHALIPCILDMEREGIRIDLDYIEQLKARIVKGKRKLQAEIFEIVGKPLELGSTKQLSDYFFNRLQIVPTVQTQKQNNSTGEKALKAIDHPEGRRVAQRILKWRELEKIDNTYLTSYLRLQHNGRIHARWNACGTLTGRFSGSSPNLMNIPKSDQIRKIFIPDSEFVDMDFSQIELKLMAHASKQKNMVNAFVAGQDLHAYTASLVLSRPMSQIDKDGPERQMAKSLNFGVIYGIGVKGLSEYAGMTIGQSKRYLDNYWKMYPDIKNYFDYVVDVAQERGYVRTLFGRKIPLSTRWYAAPNYIIQGSAGDIIKLSLFRTWKYIKQFGGSIRNTVHDQILYDNVDKRHIPALKGIMEDYNFSMPVSVDVKTSKKSWGDLYEE